MILHMRNFNKAPSEEDLLSGGGTNASPHAGKLFSRSQTRKASSNPKPSPLDAVGSWQPSNIYPGAYAEEIPIEELPKRKFDFDDEYTKR